ncbi:hypothetical protein BJV85_001808 [Clostridium acetobutylicum]|uniref:Uncharacterized protein n=2 Tax=Clostridium acetobutylicum TaxID=1488 RepID=Q97HE2_CLOAB|nr:MULTISPECIES: hypothetical protein [Clostridium]AAK80028.1 Hypothetical protein CA_C2069 [Clostridium acetobutylicum ATCC 824]ADZ21120.1 Conserved hypothetical protein [Clostridium acetobutylicum EA 2018]AEI32168.1 hypothetical protein SMB_G2102 [Clostridium acetobutylicum DSM 1731]AWV82206.1 hypothetical protein DK921_05400 [Clostridium acetobutylicum]KHD38775.1 hypothetical protein NL50_01560 [Clostridium acetobutylicum]
MIIRILIVIATIFVAVIFLGIIGCIKAAGKADELQREIKENERNSCEKNKN